MVVVVVVVVAAAAESKLKRLPSSDGPPLKIGRFLGNGHGVRQKMTKSVTPLQPFRYTVNSDRKRHTFTEKGGPGSGWIFYLRFRSIRKVGH
ncbi:MAG: hypothetical protein AB1547_06535 [Thermodesulfobacteriota bacterium]